MKFDYDARIDPKNYLVNRLYAIECMPTNTGAVAEHRLALTTGQIGAFDVAEPALREAATAAFAWETCA